MSKTRIIRIKNNSEYTIPNAIIHNGYVVRKEGKRLNPLFIATYIDRDGIDKETLKNLTFYKLTTDQLKYVWQIDIEIEGQIFKRGDPLCDEKTEKYLESTKTNISFVDVVGGYEEALNKAGYQEISSRKIDTGYVNTSDVDSLELVKDGKKYTGLQYSMQTDIDDYVILTYIFDKPYIKSDNVRNLLETCRVLEEIEGIINIYQNWTDTFKCWECGIESHWLDVPNKGIVEKFNAKKERYCGC